MAERIPLAIVGCGGMGHRHLYGLAELESVGHNPFVLVAAVDPNAENARSLAVEATQRLGRAPQIVSDLAALARTVPDLQAIDLCTDPARHHSLAAEALGRGWHVMVEKPMGLTVRACQAMLAAEAQSAGRILSVAENYRRDPINRLARALLAAGAIGEPRLHLEQGVGGGDRIFLTPWRHQKHASGLLVDVGVHYADMLEYFHGEVERVYAETRLHERIRYRPEESGRGAPGFYRRWPLPDAIEPTAEDAAYALLTFANGRVAQYTEDHAGHGRPLRQRLVYGSDGALELPGDRTGQPIRLFTRRGECWDDARLLEWVPDFRLDPVTAALYGGDRLWRYDLAFAETDRKIIAIEYADFGAAIAAGATPEVTATQGARSVAICYAMLESGRLRQPVTLADVLAGKVSGYQAEIDAHLGLA